MLKISNKLLELLNVLTNNFIELQPENLKNLNLGNVISYNLGIELIEFLAGVRLFLQDLVTLQP